MDNPSFPVYTSPASIPPDPAFGCHGPELLGLSTRLPSFHSPQGQAFVSIPFGLHGHQAIPIHSPNLRDHLTHLFLQRFRFFPKPRYLSQTIRLLAAEAFAPGHPNLPSQRPVSVRIASHNSIPPRIVLDLLDDGQTVNIGPDSWSVSSSHPACFLRSRSHSPLPHPTSASSPDFQPLARALRLTHDRHAFLRVLTWLFAAMRPHSHDSPQPAPPYPILLLRGPSGSGKSTAARFLKSLIDPSLSPLLPSPTGRRSLIRDASSNWVLAFDHVSKLPTSVSDTLCTLTSGYAHTFRDGDRTVVQNLARPMILVATERLKLHPDLAARCLVVDFDPATHPFHSGLSGDLGDFVGRPSWTAPHAPVPPPGGTPDPSPDAAFEALRPSLLGSLCTALSQMMSGQYTYAAPAELAEALKPVPSPLVRSLHKLGNFKGSATELAAALKWHSTPRHLSQELRNLTDPAFTIRFFHHHGERKIEIKFSASPPSTPPSPRVTQSRHSGEHRANMRPGELKPPGQRRQTASGKSEG